MTRPSNWARQHQGDEDFTRAAWDLVADTERTQGVFVRAMLLAGTQRGVWVVFLEARSTRTGEDNKVVASYTGSYPNGTAAALSSYLFRAANCIAQMCESARAEEQASIWGRGGRQT